MEAELSTTYDPERVERDWYGYWEQHGLFAARVNPTKKPFCITIPPPNVTGELHMGHALQHAIHDMVIRAKRMMGFETLCLPGTDHAGIATQMKVEQQLLTEAGESRYDVGREGLLERIWQWKERYGEAIYEQMRKLGCSYDWDRARFTLDDGYVEAVLQAFERFHEQGWIYRGTRMINWCPNCGTVISDLETEERELQGHLWHLRYPGHDGGPEVVVATTRPETMLGDTAVAVHPQDLRWQEAVGKLVELPLMGRAIPIVADEYADPEMGSGAVKVTPSHDPNDYEIGQRHDLEQIQVIGFDGIMTAAAGEYAGQDRYACRKAVLTALEAADLLAATEDYQHAVPHHDKCGTVIEPLPMEQWFMDMKPLAQKTIPILEQSQIDYVPDRFREFAIDWLEEIRDWALSRQIWWGHRIPAWYCVGCSGAGLIPLGGMEKSAALAQGSFRVSLEHGAKPIVSRDQPATCPDCGDGELAQDPDVLDTWFSSALWPFATLGWPKKTEELAYFHTTDLMITGRDILYLWVLRMIMTATEFVDEIPFKTVLVHPTVMTRDGRRMSKSLGTGLNPLELVEMYGADATRYGLLHQAGSSQDLRFDAEIVDNKVQSSVAAETGRNFCNKIWNATRFALMNLGDFDPGETRVDPDPAARWIRSRLARTIADVDAALAEYRLADVTRHLYDFLWRDFCDWYLEVAKVRLAGDDPDQRLHTQSSLVEVLDAALKLLHPVMPFLTEALWQNLPLGPDRAASIMVAAWPSRRDEDVDAEAEAQFALLQQAVTAVRIIRGDMNIPPTMRLTVLVNVDRAENLPLVDHHRYDIAALARADELEIGTTLAQPPASASAVVSDLQVYVPLAGVIDRDAEQKRLAKEIGKFEGLVKGLESKLSNSGFLEKAPAEVVERERTRKTEYEENLSKLRSSLELLRG